MRDEDATRYLLGELAEDEARAFEDQTLVDPASTELLFALESELHELYASGELSPERRARFAARFLHTAEGRDRQATTVALRARARRGAAVVPLRARLLRPLLALAATLLVATGLAAVLGRSATDEVLTVTLAPGALRSAGSGATLEVGPKVARVVVDLVLDGERAGPGLVAELTVGDRVAYSAACTPRADGLAVQAEIPAHLLAGGRHEIVLRTRDGPALAYYPVLVVRRP